MLLSFIKYVLFSACPVYILPIFIAHRVLQTTNISTMAKTAKGTRSKDVSEQEAVRKSPRSKSNSLALSAALPTRIKKTKKAPAKKETQPPKEPAKRGRKKKDPDQIIETISLAAETEVAKPNGVQETSTFDKSHRITEADILAADTLAKVVHFVNLLVGSQKQIFESYKRTARLQMENDSRLISQLRHELENKQKSIDSLLALLRRLEDASTTGLSSSVVSSTPQRGRMPELYELPIRRRNASAMVHQEDLANELKTIGVTLDMLELLTGVRIISYEEDRVKFYFDVKQLSTNSDSDNDAISVTYRLVIKRKFENTAEVTYVPTFFQKMDELPASEEEEIMNSHARVLAPHLPEYLKDSLIFPYNTLLQFYAKMSKALNKATKK